MRVFTFVCVIGFISSTFAFGGYCPNFRGVYECVETASADAPTQVRFITHYSEDFVVYFISSKEESLGLRADGMEYPMTDDGRVNYKAYCEGNGRISFVIEDRTDPEIRLQRERTVIQVAPNNIEMIETVRSASQGEKLKDVSHTRWSCSAIR